MLPTNVVFHVFWKSRQNRPPVQFKPKRFAFYWTSEQHDRQGRPKTYRGPTLGLFIFILWYQGTLGGSVEMPNPAFCETSWLLYLCIIDFIFIWRFRANCLFPHLGGPVRQEYMRELLPVWLYQTSLVFHGNAGRCNNAAKLLPSKELSQFPIANISW